MALRLVSKMSPPPPAGGLPYKPQLDCFQNKSSPLIAGFCILDILALFCVAGGSDGTSSIFFIQSTIRTTIGRRGFKVHLKNNRRGGNTSRFYVCGKTERLQNERFHFASVAQSGARAVKVPPIHPPANRKQSSAVNHDVSSSF